MIYLLLLIGGFINLYRVYGLISNQSKEEAPFKGQAYGMAFGMGCLFIGVPLALIYWLVF